MTTPDIKDTLKRSRLSYKEAAVLLGVGIETLRSWINAASKRHAPPRYSHTLDWLTRNGLADLVLEEVADAPLVERLVTDSYMRPPGDDARADLESVIFNLSWDATVRRDVSEVYPLAARLLSVLPALTIARLLRLCPPPAAGVTVAYEFEADGLTVALLQAGVDDVDVRLVRDVVMPGRAFCETVPVSFRFSPAVLRDAVDTESAAEALRECVATGQPYQLDGASGEVAMIALQAWEAIAHTWLPVIFRVLVAHVLVERAAIPLDGGLRK